jgi:hypothetical protein
VAWDNDDHDLVHPMLENLGSLTQLTSLCVADEDCPEQTLMQVSMKGMQIRVERI